MHDFLHPELSTHTQALIRTGYGILLLAFLLQTLPVARWFFVSDRWRGYAKSGPVVDLLQNPVSLWFVMAAWLGCAAMLVTGFHAWIAALVNLLLCRYFFVHMRWKGVLRGGGAPGFMAYWWSAVVFFLEGTSPGTALAGARPVALLAAKVDFAFILLSSGLYKILAGYPRNDGMELGVVNPWWGYWAGFYRRLPPGHVAFRAMNHLAYTTEIAAGLLMLFPRTQLWGAALIVVSFAFICTHIRLGFLTEMMILTGLLYVTAGTPVDEALRGLPVVLSTPSPLLAKAPEALPFALAAFFWTYLALLPAAHAGLYYNFLARKRFLTLLQSALERYTNFFGIIIWRVFTLDVINFFVRAYVAGPPGAAKREYTEFRFPDPRSRFRYWHVCEFVCFASVFTTLKYYPGKPELFRERLLRYARTLPCGPGQSVVFEYVSLRKNTDRFDFVPVAEFAVDPAAGTVEERGLHPDSGTLRGGHPTSPVHEAGVPGSYAPPRPDEAR